MLKRLRRWFYVHTLERQYRRMVERGATAPELRRKERAIYRAKSGLLAALFIGVTFPACAHVSTSDALMLAATAAQEARMRCEAKLGHMDGDTSPDAVRARRECLGIPSLELEQDAADAVAFELNEARRWVLSGAPTEKAQ